jgi:hypothetical protein
MTADGPLLPGSRELAVVFVFPDTAEIRYLSRLPVRGAHVQSSSGQTFFVASLLQSGERTFTAHCVAYEATPARAQEAKDEQEGTGALDDLAGHLQALARRTIEAPARLRRRYRMRDYYP